MIIYSGDRGSAGDDRSKLIGVLVLFKPSEFTPDWEEQGEDFNANFERVFAQVLPEIRAVLLDTTNSGSIGQKI